MPAARSLLVVTALAGCWRADSGPQTTAIANAKPGDGLVMSSHGVGPFDAHTRATRAELQAEVPQLRVVTHDLGGDSGIVYDVFDGTERLLYAVPDDAPGWTEEERVHRYSTSLFAIFAVSPRVKVLGRSWRVGEPFQDASGIDICECWGDDSVTACFRHGTHVRLIFEAPCTDARQRGAKAMIGVPIGRIMWKREIEPAEPPPDDWPD